MTASPVKRSISQHPKQGSWGRIANFGTVQRRGLPETRARLSVTGCALAVVELSAVLSRTLAIGRPGSQQYATDLVGHCIMQNLHGRSPRRWKRRRVSRPGPAVPTWSGPGLTTPDGTGSIAVLWKNLGTLIGNSPNHTPPWAFQRLVDHEWAGGCQF